MSNKTKLAKTEKNHRKIKLPRGVVLLAKPLNPQNDFKCVRCEGGPNRTGYEWQTRKQNVLPVRCPYCSSPSWNKSRVRAGLGGTKCHCQNCKHNWTPVNGAGVPIMCPKCKTYDWNGKAGLPSIKPAGLR